MKPHHIISLLCCIILLCSCKKDSFKQTKQIISENIGKELIVPTSLRCYNTEAFVLSKKNSSSQYKIVTYLDSDDCISCKLQLNKWNKYKQELTSNNVNVSFMFVFCTSVMGQIENLLTDSKSSLPFYIDSSDSMKLLNKLPDDFLFRTFLLNDSNKILAVGNPIIIPEIRTLFNKRMNIQEEKECLSDMSLSTNKIVFTLKQGNEILSKDIYIRNKGNNTLIIDDIETSCDCISAKCENHYIPVGQETKLTITHTSSTMEDFFEKVYIKANTGKQIQIISVEGNTNDNLTK